jgi:hypothetical protein
MCIVTQGTVTSLSHICNITCIHISHLRNSATFLYSYSSRHGIGNEVFSYFTCPLYISRAHSTFHVPTTHFTFPLHISRAQYTFTNILPSSCFLMSYTVEPFPVFVHLSPIGMVNSALAVFSRFIQYKLHSQFFPHILIFNKSIVLQSRITRLYRTVHCTYLCRLL